MPLRMKKAVLSAVITFHARLTPAVKSPRRTFSDARAILRQTAWAIIQLSKLHTKPCTLYREPRDQIFQSPSPFLGGGAWVRGYP